MQDASLIVPDATEDVRFRDNPLVTGEFHLRFYAGAFILVLGQALGSASARADFSDSASEDGATSIELVRIAVEFVATVAIFRRNRRKLSSQLNTFMDELMVTCAQANRQVHVEPSFDSTAMTLQPQHQELDPVENIASS